MTRRRIVLLGFMGCGKTSVARELARKLECPFVDLDSFIYESQRRSPAQIIREDGEPEFRAIEAGALADVLKQTEIRIIALGGGTWTVPANRERIGADHCLSVWLDAPFDLCWERISSETNATRPLAPHREAAQQRYDSRRAEYSLAEFHVAVTDQKEITEILDEIVSALC